MLMKIISIGSKKRAPKPGSLAANDPTLKPHTVLMNVFGRRYELTPHTEMPRATKRAHVFFMPKRS